MDSTFQIGSCECPDINASTFAIDINGRFVVLAGRKGILMIDLNGEKESLGDLETARDDNVLQNASNLGTKNLPIVKRVPRTSKYDSTSSHFNRHVSDLFAMSTYQLVEVFSIEDLHLQKPKVVLRGHSRAIADIEWSHYEAYYLATSGADCSTNLWDIRDSRRPMASLTSVCGPTQVRHSKTSSYLIATSHEIDVRIWDIRQPNLPVYYIAAHLQKINGMDWKSSKIGSDHDQIITCSQDNSIKLWDLNSNKVKPSANFSTKVPAWRVRYTPISSNAILTSTLPQLRSRNECHTMKLWSMKPGKYNQKKLEPILALTGHTDVVIDFDWRARPLTDDLELVSWSKDRTLRIWRLDHQMIDLTTDSFELDQDYEHNEASFESINPRTPDIDSTSPNRDKPAFFKPSSTGSKSTKDLSSPKSMAPRSPLSTIGFEEDRMPSAYSKSTDGSDIDDDIELVKYEDDDDNSSSETLASTNELKQEFNLLNRNIPNLEFDEINSLRRVCLVTARAKTIICRLRVALPPSYPQTDCPTFTILDDNCGGQALTNEAKAKLLESLYETAKSQLSRGRNCIEPCLRRFAAELQKHTSISSTSDRLNESGLYYQKDDSITLSAQRDHSIPFPPTCGARFCGNQLVCFGRPIISSLGKQVTGQDSGGANWLVETPRSMAQLSAQLDNMRRQGHYNLSTISISHFYYGSTRRTDLLGKNMSRNLYGSKYLSNRGKSIPVQSLSKTFKPAPVVVYDLSDILGGLSRELAENYVFDKDVIRMCRRNAEVATSHNRKDLVQIWLLAKLSSEGVLNSYAARSDQETNKLSMINDNSDFGDRPWTLHPFGSKLIQSLIDHYVINCNDVQTAAMLVWTFSSPKAQQQKQSLDSNDRDIDDGRTRLPKFNILSPERALQNDLIMHVYAELLYRLNLLNQRAMVLKNIGSSSTYIDLFNPNRAYLAGDESTPDNILLNLRNLCYNPLCRNHCCSVQCPSCKMYSFYCSICRLPVKGSCSICMKCLHGGHVNHFDAWFSNHNYCPTGCGCECLNID